MSLYDEKMFFLFIQVVYFSKHTIAFNIILDFSEYDRKKH